MGAIVICATALDGTAGLGLNDCMTRKRGRSEWVGLIARLGNERACKVQPVGRMGRSLGT